MCAQGWAEDTGSSGLSVPHSNWRSAPGLRWLHLALTGKQELFIPRPCRCTVAFPHLSLWLIPPSPGLDTTSLLRKSTSLIRCWQQLGSLLPAPSIHGCSPGPGCTCNPWGCDLVPAPTLLGQTTRGIRAGVGVWPHCPPLGHGPSPGLCSSKGQGQDLLRPALTSHWGLDGKHGEGDTPKTAGPG